MAEVSVSEQVRRAADDIAVSSPPTAEIVRVGSRRRRARRVGGATAAGGLAVVTIVVGLIAGQLGRESDPGSVAASPSSPSASPEAAELNRDSVEDYLRETPGVPLALPTELPPGYEWLGPWEYQKDDHGDVIVRSSMFAAVDGIAGSPRVTICLHAPQGLTCPQGASRINRTVGGHEVVISFRGPTPAPDQLNFWRSVSLETDAKVAWLH